ncbi:MAG: divalent-cation tolerance protein CutA [Deltaproteobacteria bacterium]|nr:divalent-cation tolerance protein CutA [Deltaproteobacteria bacterium]
MEFIQVMTTTGTREEAQAIARDLVGKALAGCVQIVGPIESTYRWRGAVETSAEHLCLIKTRRDLFPRVESAIRERHSYETPEITAVPITQGGTGYLAWLAEALSSPA